MAKQFITKEGLKKIKTELDYLKTKKRHEISTKIKTAKDLGDLSENAEYIEAKEQQAFNETRIAELEDMIKNSETINQENSSGIVIIGSTIKIKNCFNGKILTITIVGSNEADPSEGKISNESPMAISFLGHKINDRVEIKTPKGKVEYIIKKIL